MLRSQATYLIFRTKGKAVIHAHTVSESVNPNLPQSIMLSVVEARKCIISAFDQVSVPLVLGILQKVVVIINRLRPEQLHSFQKIHKGLAHMMSYQRCAKNICEEVAGCQVPIEGIFSGSKLRGWNVELDKAQSVMPVVERVDLLWTLGR
jgi:hypothetical protein